MPIVPLLLRGYFYIIMSTNSKLKELQEARSLEDLASILSTPLQLLTYVLHGRHHHGLVNYKSFNIIKKSGGIRTINAPIDELKSIQKKLSTVLQDCQKTINILEGHRTHDKKLVTIAHGFIKGKSIITNAEPHRNRKFVLNIDLQDFFDSIHYGRIYGFLVNNKHFKLNENIARAITNLACHDGKLPQGAPTSPIISNLIAGILDIRLAALAYKHKLHYTRYADDITLSTNLNEFPSSIAYIDNAHVVIGNKLRTSIEKQGFSINHQKSRLQFKNSRQDVTGLIVNKKINVKNEYRNRARVLWNKIQNGKEIYAIGSEPEKTKNINYLVGVLSYIYHVRNSNLVRNGIPSITHKKPTKKEIDSTLDANARMYRDVLFFKYFIANKKPIIICEGKTDIIYIRSALLSLARKHRSLIDKKEAKIDFLRVSKTIKELFKISGGTGDIGNLISNYSSYCEHFKRFSPMAPVIILIDNDSGAAPLRSLIKEITKTPFKKEDDYKYIINNLYIIQTPSIDGKDSAIEDLFDKKILQTKLDGKSFIHKQSTFDIKKHYGKNHFAEYVVRQHQKEIDFSRFNLLFDSIKKIIKDYKSKPH
ncbi:retron Ec67 family RNA-directed DNA polymerase/endonuclease [Klebsiella oxytoca]|uniref:retron Ec67 family RNA-directed DNA polymerase/endonuclease n=1 Tax=Klebsiella oxytoca TaxID=571 RepID=UPI001B99D235|nr:retron Ec67 family RNA-directed DNA polymerase/endonuclease [Klebsiella oxytoca]EKU2383567.1 retron Ec67 family RNA-directed DNA polymerase/endonuclease [Klebsiella oxytoca]MBX4772349.1 retron Ec67 family RNA-directed DNA polymerase/endonuclease [Klebsiella oxytoca]HBC7471450.1 retron Ec67 family RNA-directed DNA polymerase/endonuclease [Klebsiella oxytoca]HCJ6654285.1 retron Ec67 family RNA-directed DNA polymerase/endonuclease [Klebsiella oxytoca]HCJ7380211.1 retron Ec67 family RNA-directe